MLSELDLHVTNRCTTSCQYCCFSSNRKKMDEMSTCELMQLMRDAVALGCNHVHFTGGEPLLRDDIEKLITFAGNLGLEMRLQTNGMLLNQRRAEKLMAAGLSSIMISLDADRPEEHDAMRGAGTWALAVKAILAAQDAGMAVRVNSVMTKVNWKRIHQTARFVHNMGITTYSAFYFSPIGSGVDVREVWIRPEAYMDYWRKLTQDMQQDSALAGMDIVIEKGYASWEEAQAIDISAFTGCGGGCQHTYARRDYLIVRCDGSVYPCIMGIDGEPLGNIHQQSLNEIYHNSPRWESLKPRKDPFCDGCEYYALCSEGCRYYPQEGARHDCRCARGRIVPLCPIMKYNTKNDILGGSSDDVLQGE